MDPFKHGLVVISEDIDELGHVNNVVYVRWVQEGAAAHWDAIAPQDMKDRYLWVVLRHEIDYKHPCFLNDRISGATWVGEHHGARFERYVTLHLENTGKLLAEAKTIWCLLDRASMKPLRIPGELLQIL